MKMCDNEPSPTPYPGMARGMEVWKQYLFEIDWSTADSDKIHRWATTVANWLTDACLLHDSVNLHAGLETLRSSHVRHSGSAQRYPEQLLTSIEVLAEAFRAALERARQWQLAETLPTDSLTARILELASASPDISRNALLERLWSFEVIEPAKFHGFVNAAIENGLLSENCVGGGQYRLRLTPRGMATAERLRERQRAALAG